MHFHNIMWYLEMYWEYGGMSYQEVFSLLLILYQMIHYEELNVLYRCACCEVYPTYPLYHSAAYCNHWFYSQRHTRKCPFSYIIILWCTRKYLMSYMFTCSLSLFIVWNIESPVRLPVYGLLSNDYWVLFIVL